MNKRYLWNIFQYALAASLLVIVIWANWGTPGSNGFGDLWRLHVNPPEGVDRKPIHWNYFFAAFAIQSAAAFLTLLRWYLLVRAQDLKVSLGQAVRLGLIGCFFNAFLPGSVGGDIIKAAALASGQERRTVAVATVIMDRVIALWGLVWFVAMSGSIFWLWGTLDGEGAAPAKTIVVIALCIVGVTLAVWLAMGLLPDTRAEKFAQRLGRLPKVGGSASELWRAVWLYRCRQTCVWVTMCLSWVGHVCMVLACYWGVQTLVDASSPGAIPSLEQHFLLVPIGLVIKALPMFPGGAGIGEAGFGGLYKLFSCPAGNGALASLMYYVIGCTFGLIGFAIYCLQPRPKTVVPVAAPSPRPTSWVHPHAEGVTTT